MTRSKANARSILDDWHAAGADRMDLVRFHHMDGLCRRAESCNGAVRDLLDARLSLLLASYAADLERRPDACAGAATPALQRPLQSLLEHFSGGDSPRTAMAASKQAASTGPASPQRATVQDMRRLWTRVRTGSQLRQSLEQTNEDAGPLNSGRLVHRALIRMQALSPAYLQHFMAYVDELSGLEQLRDSTPSPATAPATAKPRKRASARSRKRDG